MQIATDYWICRRLATVKLFKAQISQLKADTMKADRLKRKADGNPLPIWIMQKCIICLVLWDSRRIVASTRWAF